MLTRDAVRIRLISDRRVTGAGDESGQDVVREESLPECDKLVCPISVRYLCDPIEKLLRTI